MSFCKETWNTIVSAFDFEWSNIIDQPWIPMTVQSLTWFEVLCCFIAISCICKSVWIYGAHLVSCFRSSPAHVTYDSELVDEVCDAFDMHELLPKPRTSDFVNLANFISQMGAASLDTNNVDSEEDDDYRESQEPSTSLDTSHDSSNFSDTSTDSDDHQHEDNEDMPDDISQSCTSNDGVGTNDTNTVAEPISPSDPSDPIEPVVPSEPVLRRSRRLAQKRLQKQAVLLDVVDAFMQQRLDRRKLE